MKIKDLMLAVSATPKKADIRFYLNGILITRTHIVASDGHRLVRIMREDNNAMPDNLEKLIIPLEAVKNFLKKFSKKEQECSFDVVRIGESYALQHGNAIEVFEPIEHSYPDFKKVFDNIEAERLKPKTLNLSTAKHTKYTNKKTTMSRLTSAATNKNIWKYQTKENTSANSMAHWSFTKHPPVRSAQRCRVK